MTVPDLIVIGAQKCGTTTLYEDLAQHPDITMSEKESSALLSSNDPGAIKAKYAEIRISAPESPFVEVSTEYAMRPLHEVAGIAATVAPGAQIVYIVRDPVARVISHHHHEVAARTMSTDINAAVRKHERLIDYSRYAYQIRPWLDAFGRAQVHFVQFEHYMADRVAGANRLYSLLDLAPFSLPDPESVHNAATHKRVGVGIGGLVANHALYRTMIRPRIPHSAKETAKRILLPKAPPRPAPPSQETVKELVYRLTPEVTELASLVGEGPWWDLEDRWVA